MTFNPELLYCLVLLLISSCDASTDKQEHDNTSTDQEESDISMNSNESGFVQIFDGKTLVGWEGDTTYWRVENGNLVGEITSATPLEHNSFLIWRGGLTKDFQLKVETKVTANGNTGINYRSEALDDVPYALRGYQADIDGANRYTGQNYEERGRTTLAYRGQKVKIAPIKGSLQANIKNNAWTGSVITESLGDTDSLKAQINNDWNEIHIIAKGNHLQHYVNGVLMSDVTDNDTINRNLSGLLGVQVHTGPPMKVMYRNFRIKQINK